MFYILFSLRSSRWEQKERRGERREWGWRFLFSTGNFFESLSKRRIHRENAKGFKASASGTLPFPHARLWMWPEWEKWVPQTIWDPLCFGTLQKCGKPASPFPETAGDRGQSWEHRLSRLTVPPGASNAMRGPCRGQNGSGDFCEQEVSMNFLWSLW